MCAIARPNGGSDLGLDVGKTAAAVAGLRWRFLQKSKMRKKGIGRGRKPRAGTAQAEVRLMRRQHINQSDDKRGPENQGSAFACCMPTREPCAVPLFSPLKIFLKFATSLTANPRNETQSGRSASVPGPTKFHESLLPEVQAAAGIRMVAQKPWPGSLASSNSPSCSSAKALTSVRPRPAPLACSPAAPACSNGS